MYFNQFPTIEYDVTGSGTKTQIKDILMRVKVRDYVKKNHAWFAKYIVKMNQLPEMVAFDVYGKSTYHWVVLLFNQITNPYYEWPLKRNDFFAFINDKYTAGAKVQGSVNPTTPNGIHHYEISQQSGNTNVKIKVESTVAGAVEVTNLEYEESLQNKKREIRILKPQYLGQFTTEFKTLMGK